MLGGYIMEKVDELIEHIKENTNYLYPKDISIDTLLNNLMGRGMQFVTKTDKQSVVDLCTLALVIYLKKSKD